ncbi:MAG: MBL fold metallo-hydrolase [Desulfobacterales bacterium]|nr:MBL fold metallo-hydrolase [Desulfobacterales bacterium]
MHITCLVENALEGPRMKALPGLEARHGFSLLIETGGNTLLFDMGPDHTLIGNAEALGIDLTKVDMAILSHGHIDHGGGIASFQVVNSNADIYISPDALSPSAVKMFGFTAKSIGVENVGIDTSRLRPVTADTKISDHLELFCHFESDGFIPKSNRSLFRMKDGDNLEKDDFSHEIALLAREDGKTVLFTGCSHSGIGNMIQTVLNRTGLSHIDYVIGGFHLCNPITGLSESQTRLDTLVAELERFDRTHFYSGHCTGLNAYVYLKNILGDRISRVRTGMQLDL